MSVRFYENLSVRQFFSAQNTGGISSKLRDRVKRSVNRKDDIGRSQRLSLMEFDALTDLKHIAFRNGSPAFGKTGNDFPLGEFHKRLVHVRVG